MIWIEVFGGGIGGLVARSRPGVDPTPQEMSGVYLQYCSSNPDGMPQATGADYAAENEDHEVVVASDADVGVIADHAARLVPDCLMAPEQSRFPHSMYLIGLAKGWVFDEPFATIPLSMEACRAEGWMEHTEKELADDDVAFLLGLIHKNSDAAANTTNDRSAAG
jgi:sulfur-carrier protein adenylyltransferase/sulfurtransferase